VAHRLLCRPHRTAGFATTFWLILAGIFAKVAAIITTIPQPVLGGMTTFLFANVACVGIKIIASAPITRRTLFILTMALGWGLAVELLPNFVDQNLWPATPDMSPTMKGLNDSVQIVLTKGFMLGTIISITMNLLLPYDDDSDANDYKGKVVRQHSKPVDSDHSDGDYSVPKV
jgi:xanthine/uracil permease